MKNQLKDFFEVRNATNTLARRIKNLRIIHAKKNIQISIDKLRDREQIISELIHKSDIIQGEVVIYVDDTGTEHVTLLVIPKSHILLYQVRLENHFLFPVMCLEQPESMSHLFSRPPSITYMG
jgi:hypothetical protein